MAAIASMAGNVVAREDARRPLLRAFEVNALSGIDPNPFTLVDELGNLDRDAIAQACWLGAGGLGRGLHYRRSFYHLQLSDCRQLDCDRSATQPLGLKGHPRLQPLGLISDRFFIQGKLVIIIGVHDVYSAGVAVEDLHLSGVEPGLFHKFGGAEAMLKGGAGIQVAHAGLDEGSQVSRCSMSEFHDPTGLAFEVDDVSATNICGLHQVDSRRVAVPRL